MKRVGDLFHTSNGFLPGNDNEEYYLLGYNAI
jgi:hypothetical protein